MVAKRESDTFPNPIKQRQHYMILNQGWEISLNGKEWQDINVPYCPQSVLSGIGYTDVIHQCVYRKTFHHSKCEGKVILHFGAVDYRAIVSVNGHYIGTHTGGFTPFEFDITSSINEGTNEISFIIKNTSPPYNDMGGLFYVAKNEKNSGSTTYYCTIALYYYNFYERWQCENGQRHNRSGSFAKRTLHFRFSKRGFF